MKILEQNEDYEILEDVFNGQPITIRRWYGCHDAVELRVNDNFAKANGYQSVADIKSAQHLNLVFCSQSDLYFNRLGFSRLVKEHLVFSHFRHNCF